MIDAYVALDLETTGLDPRQDEIIEVAATKFRGSQEIATFQTLVRPRKPVPYPIQLLTGIGNNDLQDAPPFAVIAGDLLVFLGGHPLIAHNAPFDIRFLTESGLDVKSPIFDTLDLAKILLPQAPERNLGALAAFFNIQYDTKHRALSDARAARDVFMALRDRALSLDAPTLNLLSSLGPDGRWPLTSFFQEALQERLTSSPGSLVLKREHPRPETAVDDEWSEPAAGAPASRDSKLDVDVLTAFLGPDGPLARVFPGFEHRPEQVTMTQAIAEAFNQQHHLLAEAGTGTGKSLAYLLPSLCFALQRDTRVVVSTNTINLQEQIMSKDIPLLLSAFATAQGDPNLASLPASGAVRIAQLKGRGNYLCPRRWHAVLNNVASDTDPSVLGRIAVWLTTTTTGDRAELNLNNQDLSVWHRLSAQSQNCPADQCLAQQRGRCYLQRARQRAADAHILVVNHALLLSDLNTGNNILPDYDYLVVDEAHHLEDVATDQLGFQTDQWEFEGFLDRLSQEVGGRRQGFLPVLDNALRNGAPLFASQHALQERTAAATDAVVKTRPRVTQLFGVLQAFVRQHGEGSAEYGRRLRLTSGPRHQPAWSNVEQAWEDLHALLRDLSRHLDGIHSGLEALDSAGLPDYDDLLAESAALLTTNGEFMDQGNAVIARPDQNWVSWLSAGGQHETVLLCAAPIEVGPLLQKELFAKKTSVVLTSATLRTGGSFQYMKGRLGLEDPQETAVDSPFAYRQAALVLVPQDAPEPQRPGSARVLEDAIARLCAASQGRALVLFTSYAALQSAYRTLSAALDPSGVRVLAQGVSGNTHQLLERLRNQEKTVLLGTNSFWEGVDVSGEALSLLIITKLPFTVPTEPVFAARSELFDDPFRQYAVPQAVLRFRQGFGRLIRSKSDRGVAVVLDPRVSGKGYGRSFLESLPDVTMRYCALREAPRLTEQWLKPGA